MDADKMVRIESPRVWQGSVDLKRAWHRWDDGTWCPKSRAFQVDIVRLSGECSGHNRLFDHHM